MKRVLVLALTGLACSRTEGPVHDAAVERGAVDAMLRTPDGPPALVVYFAIEGCPSFDAKALSCTVTVPVSVRFVPLVTATVAQYLWDFGDSSFPDPGITPIHEYTQPGVYTVKLVVSGLDGAVVSQTHPAFVVAIAAEIGDPCDSNTECAGDLSCLCPTSTSCAFGPPQGVCASTCQSGGCPSGQVCAGLAAGNPPSGTAQQAWQTSLCLRGCSTDADCSGQLRCRLLPPATESGSWVQGCFGDYPVDVGQACADGSGVLRDDLCASGRCADLGVRGLCTMACSSQACPPDSDCAALGDGRKLCLRSCSDSSPCASDPLLDCVPPGPGDLGYQIVSPDSGAASSHCAPKPCNSDDDCGPSGRCESAGSDSHCVARTD